MGGWRQHTGACVPLASTNIITFNSRGSDLHGDTEASCEALQLHATTNYRVTKKSQVTCTSKAPRLLHRGQELLVGPKLLISAMAKMGIPHHVRHVSTAPRKSRILTNSLQKKPMNYEKPRLKRQGRLWERCQSLRYSTPAIQPSPKGRAA